MKIQLFHGDCLEVMRGLPDASVDLVLCDLPYGTTELEWDEVIPFEPLWEHYWRVLKRNGVVVLTSTQPFTTKLISSQIEHFKYTWYWHKSRASGFVHAKNMPLKDCEDVCVFSKGVIYHEGQNPDRMPFYPQGLREIAPIFKKGRKMGGQSVFRQNPSHGDYFQTITGYPRQVLKFQSVTNAVHPTQKPVELFEYFINTYTKRGQTILDNTMGSGTTGVACANLGRNFIGIEKDRRFYDLAKRRIYGLPSVEASENPQVLGAQMTHYARTSRQEAAIQSAIKAAKKKNLKVTKTLIAEMVGISRQQISTRYGHLFSREVKPAKLPKLLKMAAE